MVRVNVRDKVKFRKVKKIRWNDLNISKDKWYEVVQVNWQDFYVKDNKGINFLIAKDEFKYIKKIKTEEGIIKWQTLN